MRSGQFFVCFVIHLQTKLELFILQQNAVLFSTARFLWQVIVHAVACCEIKIQLFLKFRWHDPIGLWYIISHFYYLNWEGLHKMKSFERVTRVGKARGREGTSVEYNFCNLKSILLCNSRLSYLETVNGRKKSLFYIWSD